MKLEAVFLALALVGAAVAPAFAHGTNEHLKGTARELSQNRLVVEDPDGKSHEVELGPKTKYRDADGGAAEASDLRSGDRVVVHFGDKGAKAPAAEIRFSHPTP